MCWFFKRKRLNIELDYDKKLVSVKGFGFLYDTAKMINEKAKQNNLTVEVATLLVSGTDGVYIQLNDGWQFTREVKEEMFIKTRVKYRKKLITTTNTMSLEHVLKRD